MNWSKELKNDVHSFPHNCPCTNNSFCQKSFVRGMLLFLSCTCWRAASSLSCFRTESLHTASQRPSSSSICSCSQWASAVLLLVRSLTERFRVRMHPARFPNSFWKAWEKEKEKKNIFLREIGFWRFNHSQLLSYFYKYHWKDCTAWW